MTLSLVTFIADPGRDSGVDPIVYTDRADFEAEREKVEAWRKRRYNWTHRELPNFDFSLDSFELGM